MACSAYNNFKNCLYIFATDTVHELVLLLISPRKIAGNP